MRRCTSPHPIRISCRTRKILYNSVSVSWLNVVLSRAHVLKSINYYNTYIYYYLYITYRIYIINYLSGLTAQTPGSPLPKNFFLGWGTLGTSSPWESGRAPASHQATILSIRSFRCCYRRPRLLLSVPALCPWAFPLDYDACVVCLAVSSASASEQVTNKWPSEFVCRTNQRANVLE